MATLSAFCDRAGIDRVAVAEALTASRSRDDAPWYMQAVLGIGAWVTAIAGLFFAWAVMDLVFGLDEPNLVVALAGTIVFAVSIRVLRRRREGAFTGHAAVAFATAGTLMAAAGVGVPAESLWVAALTTLPFAIATIWQQRSALLQFVIVSVALLLVIAAAWDRWHQMVVDPAAVFAIGGAALLLYPPRRDVRPAAYALLVVPMLLSVTVSDWSIGWNLWSSWPTKAIYLALFGALFAVNWRRAPGSHGRLPALAGAAAIVLIALSMPTGASGALVLLALGYTLGDRPLAVIGTAAQVYFIWQFYWEMHESLLTKSIILMSAGTALLLSYFLLSGLIRHRRAS